MTDEALTQSVEELQGNMERVLKERAAMFNDSITMADDVIRKSVKELETNITNAITSLKNHTEGSLSQINEIQVNQLEDVRSNKNLFDNLNLLKSIDGGIKQLGKTMVKQEEQLSRMNKKVSGLSGTTGAGDKDDKPLTIWEKSEEHIKRTFFAVGSLVAVGFILKQIISLIMKLF